MEKPKERTYEENHVGFLIGKGRENNLKKIEKFFKVKNRNRKRELEDIAKNFEGITCDLRIGKEAFISSEDKIINVEKEKGVKISPGSTGVIQVYEYLTMPGDYMAFLTIRFKHKRKGLVNISGFHVDPGFNGHLTLSVYNAGPSEVFFRYKEPVFTLFFFRLHKSVDKKLVDKMKNHPMKHIPSESVEYLSGPPINLYKLNERLEKLENKVTTYTQILILVGAGLIASIIAYLLVGVF